MPTHVIREIMTARLMKTKMIYERLDFHNTCSHLYIKAILRILLIFVNSYRNLWIIMSLDTKSSITIFDDILKNSIIIIEIFF